MKLRLLLTLSLLSSVGSPEDRTRFRGPNGSGISKDTGFPAEFSKDKNAIWRTPVRPGKSSPVLTRRHIFLTAFEKGKLYTHVLPIGHRGDGRRVLTHGSLPVSQPVQGVSPTIVASPVLDRDTYFVFGYGSEATVPFSTPLEKYGKNHEGQISPDEYESNSVMNAIGRYIGNGDLIVTKEKWDEWERNVIGPSRLKAIRLERDPAAPNSIRTRELWKVVTLHRHSRKGVFICAAARPYTASVSAIRRPLADTRGSIATRSSRGSCARSLRRSPPYS